MTFAKTQTDIERFMDKVSPEPNSGCWLWLGGTNGDGYSNFGMNGGSVRGHRWSYEYHIGPIPEGLQIDHLCRVRCCVNPHHLEPVTNQENARRGAACGTFGTHSRSRTHCPYVHPYSEENTYTRKNGTRRCRACKLVDDRARRKMIKSRATSQSGE